MADPTNDVTAFFGGCLMSMNVSLVLYGVSTAQAYVYVLHCKNDSLRLKFLVAAIWILETIHTACIFHEIYFYTIKGFGDYSNIDRISWSSGTFLAAETAVVALVQGFYIRKIWLLSNRRIIPSLVLCFLLTLSIGSHIAAVVYSFMITSWMEYLANPAAVLMAEVANALFAAVDGLIALGMIYYLHHHRTGFKRTDGVIRWFMGYIVNTGALTMLAATTGIITLATYHRGIVAVGVSTIVSKLYANALLGFLNGRGFLQMKRQQMVARSAFDPELSPFQNNGSQEHLARANSDASRAITVISEVDENKNESQDTIAIAV